MRNVRPDKITFADFCVQYLEVKKNTLSPQTYNFYSKVIEEELMPMFARLKMKDLRTYHIQQFVQYLATEKKRLDGREGGIAASTVKRYTTILRSIVTMAYKLEYIEDDIGRSRRIKFPKEETKEVEAFTLEEVCDIQAQLCFLPTAAILKPYRQGSGTPILRPQTSTYTPLKAPTEWQRRRLITF